MRTPSFLLILCVSTLLPPSIAGAATETAQSATQATGLGWKDLASLSLDAEYDGLSTTELTFFSGTRLGKGLKAGLNLEGDLLPDAPRKFAWKDPFLQIQGKDVLPNQVLQLNSDFRIYLPATDKSRSKTLQFGLRTGQNFFLSLRQDFGVGARTMLRRNFYDRPGAKLNDWTGFVKPYLTYRMSDRFNLELLYELSGAHAYGAPALKWKTQEESIQPGVNWTLTPGLKLRPYLAVPVSGPAILSRTDLAADLKWEIL